jgi:ankyrin repeat protein
MIKMKLFILMLSLGLIIGCGKKVEESDKVSAEISTSENSLEGQPDNIAKKRTELLNAIHSNDLNLVKQAIVDNPDLIFRFKGGESPLTKAIKISKSEIVQSLIKTSQAINFSNSRGEIPLNLIIKSPDLLRDKKLDLVKMLIKKNAKINNRNAQGLTPLVSSIIFNLEEIGLTLVKRGANVELSGTTRLKPLDLAKKYGLEKLAELIKMVSNHDRVNKAALVNAMANTQINFIHYLLINYPEYIELIDKENLLIRAISNPDKNTRLRLLTYFLERGANVNGTSQNTPLMFAVNMQHDSSLLSVAKLIINKADLIRRNKYGITALIMAVQKLNSRVVDRLYDAIRRKRDTAEEGQKYKYQVVLDEACNFLPTSKQAKKIRLNGFTYRNLIKSKLGCFN